jgi:hypothetical protein
MPFPSARLPPGFTKHIEVKRPVFRVDLLGELNLPNSVIYGQSAPQAHCTIDGRLVNFDDIPLNTPLLIEDAWFTFVAAGPHRFTSFNNAHDMFTCHLQLQLLRARTKYGFMASLDYRSLLADVEESDEVTLAG